MKKETIKEQTEEYKSKTKTYFNKEDKDSKKVARKFKSKTKVNEKL